MRHCILGPGGVGGLIGAVLAGAGEHVFVVARPDRPHPSELSLESRFGNLCAPVTVIPQLDVAVDMLWITVKATQLEEALKLTRDVTKIGYVVPLLNGIDHVERLRQHFGPTRVIPATISVESERVAPGKIVQRSPFIRLSLSHDGRRALEPAISACERFGFECKLIDDEQTLLWRKLAFLAPLALSTSAARSAIGPVMEDPRRMALLAQCVNEACRVAHACGATVNADTILAAIKALHAQMRSSMEKDLASGNPPEVDAIGGPILRAAERYGIPVPATTELTRQVMAA